MLSDLRPEPARWSPWGLRIRLSADAKSPAIHAEPAFIKGLVEVQDEGSQLAALLSAAKPGEQVLDLCAGAGGKTLAMAAMMQNKGQIFATDDDKRRLASIHERLKRSGARNVQVRTPKSVGGEIDDLAGRMDLVLIDAPCTGTGAWRRNPDAKWRMRPGALEQRQKEQAEILDRAVPYSSKPADVLAMSPVRCWKRKTAPRSRPFSQNTRSFQCNRRPRLSSVSASAPSCSVRQCACPGKAF